MLVPIVFNYYNSATVTKLPDGIQIGDEVAVKYVSVPKKFKEWVSDEDIDIIMTQPKVKFTFPDWAKTEEEKDSFLESYNQRRHDNLTRGDVGQAERYEQTVRTVKVEDIEKYTIENVISAMNEAIKDAYSKTEMVSGWTVPVEEGEMRGKLKNSEIHHKMPVVSASNNGFIKYTIGYDRDTDLPVFIRPSSRICSLIGWSSKKVEEFIYSTLKEWVDTAGVTRDKTRYQIAYGQTFNPSPIQHICLVSDITSGMTVGNRTDVLELIPVNNTKDGEQIDFLPSNLHFSRVERIANLTFRLKNIFGYSLNNTVANTVLLLEFRTKIASPTAMETLLHNDRELASTQSLLEVTTA